ncbi:MAG: histidine phosphatase family protein [Alphaproteobacteria bacterium]|nr:histidine phosphatase family protein [Alphaproteobacteria bacterium]
MADGVPNAGGGAGSIPAAPFFFLRHGETDWNRERRLQGNIDVPLNETGIAQAHDAAARLIGAGVAGIVASPLARARRTAEIAAEAIGLPVEFEADLAECRLGTREGTPEAGFLERWHAGLESPEGGESFAEFCVRVRVGLTRALARPAPVLVVAHGGVFAALRVMIGQAPTSKLRNAVPLRIEPVGARAWAVAEL